MRNIDTNNIIVIDDGDKHDDIMGGDAIASSSSIIPDNGLSHFGMCVSVYINVCNMIHLYIKREYDV